MASNQPKPLDAYSYLERKIARYREELPNLGGPTRQQRQAEIKGMEMALNIFTQHPSMIESRLVIQALADGDEKEGSVVRRAVVLLRDFPGLRIEQTMMDRLSRVMNAYT